MREEVREFVRNSLNWQWSLGTHSRDESPRLMKVDEAVWFDRYFPRLEDILSRPFTVFAWGDGCKRPPTVWIDYAGWEVAPPKQHRELPHDGPWGPEERTAAEGV